MKVEHFFCREKAAAIMKDSHALDHLILIQMNDLAEQHIQPTWENFVGTDTWSGMKAVLNKQHQFTFRNAWKMFFKETWPTGKP